MKYYFVKRDLWGVKAGTVERFADWKAASLVLDGSIEPYNPAKHGDAPGAPVEMKAPLRPVLDKMVKGAPVAK